VIRFDRDATRVSMRLGERETVGRVQAFFDVSSSREFLASRSSEACVRVKRDDDLADREIRAAGGESSLISFFVLRQDVGCFRALECFTTTEFASPLEFSVAGCAAAFLVPYQGLRYAVIPDS